jgi:hypothetical protein
MPGARQGSGQEVLRLETAGRVDVAPLLPVSCSQIPAAQSLKPSISLPHLFSKGLRAAAKCLHGPVTQWHVMLMKHE